LLHHVFNRVPRVVCISEPIAFNNLALSGGAIDEAVKLKLARAALRLLGHFPGAEIAQCVVVKHFSQSTTQLKLLRDAQPDSKNLFLYRDAFGWTNSCYHFVQKYGTAMKVCPDQRSQLWRILSGGMPENYLDDILDLHGDVLNFDALSAVAWSTHMQHYFAAQQDGVALYALRYDVLLADREGVLQQLFRFLGLPVEAVQSTLSVFDKDAHEGTRSARSTHDLHFNEENYGVVRAVLAQPKISLNPEMILPNG
jgi:Sulfotransferase domain